MVRPIRNPRARLALITSIGALVWFLFGIDHALAGHWRRALMAGTMAAYNIAVFRRVFADYHLPAGETPRRRHDDPPRDPS